MEEKPIHLHKNRLNRNYNVFLLMIPTVVFVFTIVILYAIYSGMQSVSKLTP